MRCSKVKHVPGQSRVLCPGIQRMRRAAEADPSSAALLSLLSLFDAQLVSDRETPAQSPEHEQYGLAIKGPVSFKTSKAQRQRGRTVRLHRGDSA